MKALLTQNRLQKILEVKDKLLNSLDASEKDDVDVRALVTIQLCLSNDVLQKVIKEKTAESL